jgi:L-rhamnose mutarotase
MGCCSAILRTTEQIMTLTWHEWLLIPKTQEWWKIMGPMQRNLETRGKGEWWASMEEVFHID